MCGQFFGVIISLFVGFYYVSCHELDFHPNWKYLPKEECGYGAPADRIVGGKQASLGQFPWIARIGYRIKGNKKKPIYLCAGSLLNQWYVLTAVHCAIGVLGDTIYAVRLGDNYVNEQIDCQDDICAPPVQDIEINRVIKFEKYVGTQAVSYGDISLIKLAKPARYNDFVQPICLPREEILDNTSRFIAPGRTDVEVAGWGATNSVSGSLAKKLLYVSLSVVELDVCKKTFKPNKIDESQLCVGIGDGKDSCVGDSGGPLMGPVSLHSAPKYFLFGLVSYGMKWCGIGAAVYTNVTYYMPWILNHINH